MNQLYLYVALVGIALVLFALTRAKKQPIQAAEPATAARAGLSDSELKRTLDEFMSELDRENVKLLDSFTRMQIEVNQQFAEQSHVIQTLEQRVALLEAKQEELALLVAAQPVQQPAEETLPPQAEPEPVRPASFFAFNDKYAGVVELSRQGLTTDQIARETGIGIGEVQLVLDLAKREER